MLGSNGVKINCDTWCKGISEGLLDPDEFASLKGLGLKETSVCIEVTGYKAHIITAKIYLLWKEAFEEWSGKKRTNPRKT